MNNLESNVSTPEVSVVSERNNDSKSWTIEKNYSTVGTRAINATLLPNESFKETSPERVIEKMASSMGTLTKVIFRKNVSRIQKNQALEIITTVLDYEKQAIIQKITLALDIKKKETFIQYLQSSAGIQRELVSLDVASRANLVNLILELDGVIYALKRKAEERIQVLLSRKVITNQEAEEERDKNITLSRRLLEGNMATLENFLSNHSRLLEQALTIFQQQLEVDKKM